MERKDTGWETEARGGLAPGVKKTNPETTEWGQGKQGQVEEGIRAGTGWDRIKSLK